MKLARKTIWAGISLILGIVCILLFFAPFYQCVNDLTITKIVSEINGFASVFGSNNIVNNVYDINGTLQPALKTISDCLGTTIHLVAFSFVVTATIVSFITLFTKHKLTPILNIVNILLLVSAGVILFIGKDSFINTNNILCPVNITFWLVATVIVIFAIVALQVICLLEYTIIRKKK